MKKYCKDIALFVGGALFGSAGIKLLSSKDAKKVYTHATAAALRVKESVMTTVNTVQENAADILASAQDINQARTAQEEAVEDTAAETRRLITTPFDPKRGRIGGPLFPFWRSSNESNHFTRKQRDACASVLRAKADDARSRPTCWRLICRQTCAGCRQAAVHERTCCAVIHYQGAREAAVLATDRPLFLSGRRSGRGARPAAQQPGAQPAAMRKSWCGTGAWSRRPAVRYSCPRPLRIALYAAGYPSLTCSARPALPAAPPHCTWSCSTRCPSASPCAAAGLRHGRLGHVPAGAGRAAGGVDAQEVRGRPGPLHVAERGPRLAASTASGEVLGSLVPGPAGRLHRRPHGRHDPRGRHGRRRARSWSTRRPSPANPSRCRSAPARAVYAGTVVEEGECVLRVTPAVRRKPL